MAWNSGSPFASLEICRVEARGKWHSGCAAASAALVEDLVFCLFALLSFMMQGRAPRVRYLGTWHPAHECSHDVGKRWKVDQRRGEAAC